jgi:hypothetical protein
MPVGNDHQVQDVNDHEEYTSVNEVGYVNRIQCCQNLTEVILKQQIVREVQKKIKKQNIRKHGLLSKIHYPPIHRVKSTLEVVPQVPSIEADHWNAACEV